LPALAVREKKAHVHGTADLPRKPVQAFPDAEGTEDGGFAYPLGVNIVAGDAQKMHSYRADPPAHDQRSPEAAAHAEAVEGSTPRQARRPDQAHRAARHRDRAAERHSEVETTLKRESP
jgi:hypothetical protein